MKKTKTIMAIMILLMLTTTTIAIGVAPTDSNDTYTYIIYKNGLLTYAKNGATGTIEKTSLLSADVFTYAITHLPTTGGEIFVKAGSYTLTYSLPIAEGLHIIGEGTAQTTQLFETSNTPMFTYNGTKDIYFFVLEHISMYGNPTGTPTCQSAIKTNPHMNDGMIFDCCILRFKGDGINLGTTWGWRIDQSVFEYNGGDGIHLHGGCDGYITNSKIISNEGNSIDLDGSCAVIMTGNYLGESGKNGVLFNNTTVCTLIGNEFYQDDSHNTGLYSDVYLNSGCNRNIILGNQIEGASHSKYNIYLGGTSSTTRNMISLNRLSGALSGSIKRQVSNTDIIRTNIGYTTENYGTCTITNGNTITVNHGLATQPRAITITPIGIFISYYVDSVTTTQFTLHINKTTTASFYWTAYA